MLASLESGEDEITVFPAIKSETVCVMGDYPDLNHRDNKRFLPKGNFFGRGIRVVAGQSALHRRGVGGGEEVG